MSHCLARECANEPGGEVHPLSNDEIEVVCDLLWFARREAGLSVVAEQLWQRLHAIRHGDYGGKALTQVSPEEAQAVIEATNVTRDRLLLDDDEASLLTRLRSLLV